MRTLALALFSSFVIIVAFDNFPFSLLNTIWQINITVSLVDNAFLALVGTALLILAAWLDPADKGIQKLQERCSRLCFPAALGFLLLIPLQAFASWRSEKQVLSPRLERIEFTRNRLDKLRQQVADAASTDELADLLKATQRVGLSTQDRGKPLTVLRQAMLARIDAARQQLPDTRRQRSEWRQSALLRSLRVIAMALTNALAFAAIGHRRGREQSLLAETTNRLSGIQIRVLEAIERRRAAAETGRAFREEIRLNSERQAQRLLQDQLDRERLGLDEPEPLAASSREDPSPSPPSGQRPANLAGIPEIDYFEQISAENAPSEAGQNAHQD